MDLKPTLNWPKKTPKGLDDVTYSQTTVRVGLFSDRGESGALTMIIIPGSEMEKKKNPNKTQDAWSEQGVCESTVMTKI